MGLDGDPGAVAQRTMFVKGTDHIHPVLKQRASGAEGVGVAHFQKLELPTLLLTDSDDGGGGWAGGWGGGRGCLAGGAQFLHLTSRFTSQQFIELPVYRRKFGRLTRWER
jgi:hypothetical protein